MWTFEHTETTTATPSQVWRRYADPTTWPEWDHETESVILEGPFAAGTRGRLKPIGAPAVRFELSTVLPQRQFTDVSRLPLALMTFAHHLEPLPGGGSRFTHRISITGPLTFMFARLIGRKVAVGLPEAMRRLARLAEAGRVDD
ncbi:MAG: polyketide cyclase/dehydrase and lipid transport [Sphaerisporangium sp.]|nr:polyketide cyclase/dehydrase and lipid transport [Sphaerisporangium sp.]